MSGEYVYLWEFVVPEERESEFLHAYGPAGDWVRLFASAEGYVRTELYRDRARPDRFVTIDHWQSVEAWEAFRSSRAAEFETLDARCASLTGSERELGRFEPVG